MEYLGFIAAIVMGMVLGAIGGGGSILTVPILVYFFGQDASTATGYSLLIVGLTATYGAINYYRKGLIEVKAALTFAVPSIIAVYLTRAYLMPAIPEVIFSTPFVLEKDVLIMVSFAFLMMLSAYMMLTKNTSQSKQTKGNHNPLYIVVEGAVVGVATGMLGAGGGFLIIPALVLLMGMEMKKAVGASLLIISLKSLIGFTGDLQAGVSVDWLLIGKLIIFTIFGMWFGTRMASKIDGNKLQKGFGVFTLFIAIFILVKELI
ncbi:sulfite exporter TauE/SafE family protein [Alteromonas sp. ASW11-130]|uniref:sulfite exporter TauE/SafE family protein n=1 Tax=Alteromonas sp. ASW11-130 TaxID=3015775 RepID=UPI002241AB96|nr:sulfite exporter TauE/SafE family protein [Alteromonas sp. ASW11-130]